MDAEECITLALDLLRELPCVTRAKERSPSRGLQPTEPSEQGGEGGGGEGSAQAKDHGGGDQVADPAVRERGAERWQASGFVVCVISAEGTQVRRVSELTGLAPATPAPAAEKKAAADMAT